MCGVNSGWGALGSAAFGALLAVAALAASASPPLRVSGMTYVGSRGSAAELVLHSETAVLDAEHDSAELEVVRALLVDDDESLEMTCDRARLNVETNDFTAEGNVRGVTGDGQQYSAPWVEYLHEEGVLRTDAPVIVVNETGTFHGEGFVYHIPDRSFRLLGNVSVVQTP